MEKIDRQELLEKIPQLAGYRLATEADIQAGNKLFAVPILPNVRIPSSLPQPIILETPPVQNFGGRLFVCFSYEQQPKSQGHVSKDKFIAVEVEADPGPYCTTLFLVQKS